MVHVFSYDGGDEMALASDAEVLARLRDCEALVTQVTVEQSRWLAELRRRRLAAQAARHGHQVGGCCTSACCDEDVWVGLEVRIELGLTERQVHSRVDTALRLQRHPAVQAAMDDGRLQSWTATRFLELLSDLAAYVDDQRLREVEQQTLAWLLATTRSVTQLGARMRRIILAAQAAAGHDSEGDDGGDADGDGAAPDPAAARRRVVIGPAPTPGLAELSAVLPEADALAIRAALQALGHDPTDGDDRRHAEQRRADLLVTLITGSVSRWGRPADLRCALREAGQLQVRLDVTVPADTLTGGVVPGWAPGYGDVAAVTAQDLAAAPADPPCHVRPLVVDPTTGALLGFGATPVAMTWLQRVPAGRGYQHSATLETAVHLRDGTCRAPGCRRPAARCDCDHVAPYPDGETSLANSCSLCRRHHRLKTHAPGWHVGIDTDGAVTWTTPTGRRVTTQPHDYRPHPLHAPPLVPPASGPPGLDPGREPPDRDPPPF